MSESWRKIVRKLLCVRTENRWKIPLLSKYSVRIITRQINCRKISLILKYSFIIVGTRQNNLIYMLKKISIPLTSASVTSGQADRVFCQLFLQCVQGMLPLCPHIFSGDQIFENHRSTVTLPPQQPFPAHHVTHFPLSRFCNVRRKIFFIDSTVLFLISYINADNGELSSLFKLQYCA
jgi:hypothetical protein